jgi:hypothetical protein
MIGQDFRRTHRAGAARLALGFDDMGSRRDRTPQQRFEQLANEAINKYLVPIGLLPPASADALAESVIPRLSTDPETFNSPAFVLVFCCYDFEHNRFREEDTSPPARKITDAIIRQDGLSWPDIVRLIQNQDLATHLRKNGKGLVVQLWKTFLKTNGISVPDLIRYLLYAKEKLEGKIVLSQV